MSLKIRSFRNDQRIREQILLPVVQSWYNDAQRQREKEVYMWELRIFLKDDSEEVLKFAKPQHAREKIEATFKSGLLEIDKEGITIFFPVNVIQKMQMKRVKAG